MKAATENQSAMTTAELIEQAQEYSLQAEYDRAIAIYTEAIALAPGSAVAWFGRGYCRAARGENEKAIADFNEALRLDLGLLPDYASAVSQAFCERAERHLSDKEYDRALADFDQGIRLQATASELRGYRWYRRGMCQLARGDYAAAIADFDAALAMGYTGHQDCVVHARELALRLRDGTKAQGQPGR